MGCGVSMTSFKFDFDRLRDGSVKRRKRSSGPVGVVTNSTEMARILQLPRRALDFSSVPDATPLFRRPGGTMNFWPVQSAALVEANLANGLFGMLSVGAGKSLICLALPEALDSKRAVIVVPSQLRAQVQREAKEIYARHFVLPLDRITIVTYDEISRAETADVLDRIRPDLVIWDEAHKIRLHRGGRRSAGRTRLDRFVDENPGCRHAMLSGTFTKRSVRDYFDMLELCL